MTTSKAVDVEFASTQTISATLDAEAAAPPPPPPPPAPVAAAAAPAAAPPPPPPPEPRSKVPAFITGGLAVIAAGVGTVFGVLALNDKSNFDKNPTTSTADNGDTHALIADMAFGVALTFGVTSAVLFLTGRRAGSGRRREQRALAHANGFGRSERDQDHSDADGRPPLGWCGRPGAVLSAVRGPTA